MTAPIASGWSGCRVGLAPPGKRRLCTAHTQVGHRAMAEKCHQRKSRLLLMGPAMDHQLSDKRKPDPERRAAVIPIFCPYQPVVRLDNGARDGEPHPHAFRLAGEKQFEYLL